MNKKTKTKQGEAVSPRKARKEDIFVPEKDLNTEGKKKISNGLNFETFRRR